MAKIEVTIQLKPSLMDAQGATINKALHNLGYDQVKNVRIGKFIELEVEGTDAAAIEARVKEMCEKLLANPIIEDYRVYVTESQAPSAGYLVRDAGRVAYAATPRVEDWRGFHISVEDYQKLDWQAKGDLHWEFQQMHGDWIQEQMRSRGATWLLVADGAVVDSGRNRRDAPDSYQIMELSERRHVMHWLFGDLFQIEESSWTHLNDGDCYPSLSLEVVKESTGESLRVVADFDSGSNVTVLNETRLRNADLLSPRPAAVLKAHHLGKSFHFTNAPLPLRLTDESGCVSTMTVECLIVYNWEASPFTSINPQREALAGRDLLNTFPASVELDGIEKKSSVRRVTQ